MKTITRLDPSNWQLGWEAHPGAGPDWANSIPARVPGNIVADLVRAGKLPDPYWAENFRECAWAGERPFWYKTLLPKESVAALVGDTEAKGCIIFEGLDTFCEIFLNGVSLGKPHNMFRIHRYDMDRKLLRADGFDELLIRIDPVLEATRQWMAETGISVEARSAAFGIGERLAARKMQMAFGWDNCPHLLAGGIFRSVYLEVCQGPVLADTVWRMDSLNAAESSARITFSGSVVHSSKNMRVSVQGICESSKFAGQTQVAEDGSWSISIAIGDALLWWPNGMGPQNLYDVKVRLCSKDGSEQDRASVVIGLRDVRVRTGPAERRMVDFDLVGSVPGKRAMDGGMTGPWSRMKLNEPHEVEITPLEFIVNGRPVFIKGANWQHPEALAGTATDDQYRTLLQHARNANMNMIRIWGGGCIEPDLFYEECARLGLMVWQDFFFACGQFPGENSVFLKEIEEEAHDIIKRLRNYTAIVCWCGDNESDMGDYDRGIDPETNPISRGAIPNALKRLDLQQRYYHPSSPSGGHHPRSEWGGDRRNWGAWYPEGNYRHIREDEGRFISEGGSYALPSRETIDLFLPPELQWPIDNKTWRLHTGDLDSAERRFDRRNAACLAFFGEPQSLDEMITLSQFAQAWGYKLLIEHCRRRKGECGGILLWKLNDAWPAVDAGLLDHGLVPRLALQFVAEAFQPVAVSIRQPLEDMAAPLEVWGANDTSKPVDGELWVRRYEMDSSRKTFIRKSLERFKSMLAADSAACLMHISRGGGGSHTAIWEIQFRSRDGAWECSSAYAMDPRTAFMYCSLTKRVEID